MKGFALVLVSVILALALGSSPTPDDSEQCLSCQEQVAQLDSIWSNATTVAEMLTNLEAECKDKYKLVKRKICDKIAEVAVTIPPQIFEGMEGLAWDIPIATCATIHECTTNCCSVDSIEQVHLSLEHKDRSMMGVSWVTLNSQDSLVQYSITNNFETEGDTSNVVELTGAVNTYTQAGWIGTIHKAMMTNLKPATTYYYRVGSGGLWSDVFEFKTFDPAQKTINFAVVADMGYGPNSDDTVARLQEKVEKGEIDVILHNGDIGYADGYMVHWDAFFNKIQPIATRVPYMVTPGNHEFWYNFAAYKARFYMPSNSGNGEERDGSGDNMWYAWDYGNVHFAAMNSETAVDTQNFHKNMLEYFAADLQTVDRAVTPFVVAHFHRPMYCSNDKQCTNANKDANRLTQQAEELFNENKVDLVFTAHVHEYERTTQIYKNAIVAPPADGTFGAPTYILQGASGNREGNKNSWPDDAPAWSAAHSGDVGYGILSVQQGDAPQMEWTFYRSSDDAVEDNATMPGVQH